MYQLAVKILNQRRIAVYQEVPDPNDPDKKITKQDPKATKNALEKAETRKCHKSCTNFL
jgi:N12 class adenine-specific DNA methylase